MPVVLFIAIFIPLSLFMAVMISKRGDRNFLIGAVSVAWMVFGLLIVFVNSWMPFSRGGDDEGYYKAIKPINNFGELFDFTRFSLMLEQPGYAWLLSLVNTVIGHELIVFKLFNLFLLILLALTWYRIGLLLESQKFARRMALAVLSLTPLWFYTFFLLKDLTITLVQSVALLATIQLWHASRYKVKPISLFTVASLFLILLRAPLIAQSGAVLMGALTLRGFFRGVQGKRLAPLFLASILLIAITLVATNPEVMQSLGIKEEARLLGSEAMIERVWWYQEASAVKGVLFPVLYLVSETAGMSLAAWRQLDTTWLRGILALPWIFIVVPFFLVGLSRLLRGTWVEKLGRRQSRFISTPWSAVVLFVATSLVISWIVGDSTRWRIPDMPMVAAIAMAGWTYSTPPIRGQILFIWIFGATFLFSAFYFLRG